MTPERTQYAATTPSAEKIQSVPINPSAAKPAFSETLRFLMRIRLRAIIFCDNALLWNSLRLLLLLFIGVNGWFYGYLYDQVLISDTFTFPRSIMDATIHSLAMMVVFAVNYIPAYRPRSEFIHTIYPVSARFRDGLNLYSDFIQLIYGYAIAFIVMMVVGGSNFGWGHALNSLLFLLGLILTERNVKVFIEREMPHFWLNLTSVGFSGAIIGAYFYMAYLELTSSLWIQALFFIVLIITSGINYFRLSAAAGSKRDRVRTGVYVRRAFSSLDDFAVRLYLRRRTSLFTIVVIILGKAFIFGYSFFIMARGDLSDNDFARYYMLGLLLPIVPFSYVHNNLAGFFRETWLSYTLFRGSKQLMVRSWLISLALPLALDLTLSMVLIGLVGLLSAEVVLYQILVISLFIPLGIMASLHHPRFIERLFSMENISNFRNNSSGLYLFYFMIAVAALLIALATDLIWFMIIPVVLLSIVIIWAIPVRFEQHRHGIYQKLFKDE
jgi:hypothetical protein